MHLPLLDKKIQFISFLTVFFFFSIASIPNTSGIPTNLEGTIIFQVTEQSNEETLIFKIFSTYMTTLEIKSTEDRIEKVLNGKIFQETFEGLIETIRQLGIENLTSDSNGTVTVFVNHGTLNANVTYDPGNPTFQALDSVISELIDRYSGEAFGHPKAWPIDLSVLILESYPEQYDVTTIIQRGPDPLTYVLSCNVTIIVLSKNNFADILYKDSMITEIASGGQSTTVRFQIFSVPETYRPDDLIFNILVNEEATLTLDLSEGSFKVQQKVTIYDNAVSTTSTRFVTIESGLLMILAMGIITVLQQSHQQKRKNETRTINKRRN